MRLIFRICHFIVYALLFLLKVAHFRLENFYSIIRMFALKAWHRSNAAVMDTLPQRLGQKKLLSTAVIINNLEGADTLSIN